MLSGQMLSIVIPIYNEQENLRTLHEQIAGVLDNLECVAEVIYVDDGSIDSSFAIIEEIIKLDSRARAVSFVRNFGQTAAMAAGMNEARGDVIVMLDGDLQNDPADIPLLLKKIDEGYDIVSGWRFNRHDPLSKRLPSYFANKLISRVTRVRLHDYGCTLKAYRASVVRHLRLYGEMHRFIPALASIAGAKTVEVKVNHRPRVAGASNYGLGRVGNVIMDLLTVKFLLSYLSKPLYVFGRWAACLFLGAFLLIAVGIPFGIEKTGLMGGIMVLAGMQLVSLGLISELMVRIYYESQNKQPYMIKERLNCEADAAYSESVVNVRH